MGLEAMLARADGVALAARFFNAGYLRRLLIAGEWYLWEGPIEAGKTPVLQHPSFQHLPAGEATVVPVESGCRVAYRLPEGVGERIFAGLVQQLLATHLPLCRDPAGDLADGVWQQHVRDLHQPGDAEVHEAARRMLASRELLALAWRLHTKRRLVTQHRALAVPWSDEVQTRALARLPFALTPGQTVAVAEIRQDLQAALPMYRLLQGDVGSGKTALALLAALAVIAAGGQAVLLAPTAVLADQHARFVARCLDGTRVVCGLLTSGTVARDELLREVVAGRCHLLIGTHAVFESEVRFARLQLVIIDEQHKFGVAQRASLVAKAGPDLHPHLLLMTATPIPRTLALTAFGDLAVSRIVGRPPGRAAVTTRVIAGGLAQVEAELRRGQALIVCPLREAGISDGANAEDVAVQLQTRHDGVDLLHGAMSETAKLAAMDKFRLGTTRILVATTVVEVGVDVPTLAVLAVLDAERFGLAQLHQLRGRLGRGDIPGLCLLVHRPSAEARRLAILAATDDGLAIAESDLQERGPGALMGTDQHGILRLRVADLQRDLDLLQAAHQRVHAGQGAFTPELAMLAPDAGGGAMAGG